MTITTNPDITATARDAGRQVVHTVYVKGVPVATRRSASNRYRFAIARWHRPTGHTPYMTVERWSASPKCAGSSFAIRVTDI